MRKELKRQTTLFTLGILLSAAPSLFAVDFYVAQTATGAGTGADASNALPLNWLNSSTNWNAGAGSVSPGDTVHLTGTFTNSLTVQGSGAAGNPITILFEPGANFTAPTWVSGAIILSGRSWVVVDGGGTGLIQCTANGSTLASQVNSTGINGSSGAGLWHVTIQNLICTNLYKRTLATDGNRYGQGIGLVGSDLTVNHCTLSDGDTLIGYQYVTGTQSNLMINANTILNCNHGITLGAAQLNAFLNNVSISSNRIDYLSIWDGNAGLHLDGMIIFNEASDHSGSISNLQIFANYIGPNIGTITTAAVFIDTYVPSQINRLHVYNNLFSSVSPFTWNNGFIALGACTNSLVANNTFVSYNASGIGVQAGKAAVGLTNNLFYLVGTAISLGPDSTIPVGFFSDRNLFYGFSSGSGAFYHPNYSAGTMTTWQALGFDVNSSTNQPLLDTSYIPTPLDTAATDKGVSLATYFASDKNGVSRPQGKGWDIGAFEAVQTNQLPSPAVFLFGPSVISSGQNVVLSWVSSGATNLSISGIGNVPLQGNIRISPASTTTYTATALGVGTLKQANFTVTVQ